MLEAEPFAPDWLSHDTIDAGVGIDATPVCRRCEESLPAERYLHELYRDAGRPARWLSAAQKEAAWLALTAPPRSTSLIALPTGTGKSLCFQLPVRFGSGLTVVVVPTVALAIDQCDKARQLLGDIPGLSPAYFASGDADVDAARVVDDVAQRRCRLVFTSPEACVSGRLRKALDGAAGGLLETLVIDEAHLVETWGMEFRIEFQLLASLRHRWLRDPACGLRTLLLSATFTPACRVLLRSLYGGEGEWREFVAQRLRPEQVYFSREFRVGNSSLQSLTREQIEEGQRTQAVVDCAWRLPRPMVLYTTEVTQAQRLYELLRDQEGFRRLRLFTGQTRATERRATLNAWRDNEIDLVVATSAFGLGVDKSDVRSVVHACLPENLHRYYQEVGRSGRDGYSAVCILLPTSRDFGIAKGLTPTLLGEDLTRARWAALWRQRRPGRAPGTWEFPTDAVHEGLLAEHTGQQNIDWNHRLMLLMHRAGVLEILDVTYELAPQGDEAREWIEVRLGFPAMAEDVAALIKDVRAAELAEVAKGYERMRSYIQGERRCVNRLLQAVYGADHECGGCPACRANGRRLRPTRPLHYVVHAGQSPRVTVVPGMPNLLATHEMAARQIVREVVQAKGFIRLACAGRHLEPLGRLMGAALDGSVPRPYRVDVTDAERPFDLGPQERLAVLHLDQLDRAALEFRDRGAEVVHLIAERVPHTDAAGRYPLESSGAALLPYHHWIRL